MAKTGKYYLDFPHLYQLEQLKEGTHERRKYYNKNEKQIEKEKKAFFGVMRPSELKEVKQLERKHNAKQLAEKRAEVKAETERTKRFLEKKKKPEYYTLEMVLYTFLEDNRRM